MQISRSKVTQGMDTQTHIPVHWIDCSTSTTKVVGNNNLRRQINNVSRKHAKTVRTGALDE